MSSLLLMVIYVAFIGLGIPDSLFGSAWPAIYQEFSLPVSHANLITLLISGCTIISSLFSAQIIHAIGTARVTALSTVLTAAALYGFSVSDHFLWICLFAVPLGLGAGAIDAALNHYVSMHYKVMHMNFLHCFYGIGVSFSPYLMSLALQNKNNWRTGYRFVFWIQLSIAFLTTAAIPLWKKVQHDEKEDNLVLPAEITPLPPQKMLKLTAVRTACMIFISACALEYTAGIWGSTYLVQAQGLSAETAARLLTLYYMGIACGRFLSGTLSALFSDKLRAQFLIYSGQGILAAALVLFLLPLPTVFSAASLFLIGLGIAPLFPNLLHIVPQYCSKKYAQSFIGLLMAAAYTGIMLVPVLFGWLAQKISICLFPGYLSALFLIMIVFTVVTGRLLRK